LLEGWAIYLDKGQDHISYAGESYIPSKLNQNRLHSIIATPVCEARKLGRIDYAVSWVDAGKVDFIDELDGGWLIGVLISAMHLEGVDSVLMNALPDGLISVCECLQAKLVNVRGEDQELCHSSLTLTCHLLPQDHKSMPLL